MSKYYSQKLSAERLRQVYEIASPRVKQYLEAEVRHVLEKTRPEHSVIELGCGYGRILPRLAARAKWVAGIDTSIDSLILAKRMLEDTSNCSLYQMDANRLGFRDGTFDIVICIQNGISAFQAERLPLLKESIRVARPRGVVMFSTYSERFWRDRLEWFEQQARLGLIGEIDYDKTGDGVIACKDGFKSSAVKPSDFLEITSRLKVGANLVEVDGSSLFYEISKPP